MKRVRSDRRRRGVALVAVAVVGLSLLLLTVGILGVVRADVVSIRHSEREIQMRLAAASAVDVILDRLGEQRMDLASGGRPQLDPRLEMFELDANRIVVARILEPPSGRSVLSPEAGRLDLNLCDEQMLRETGLFTDVEVAAVLATDPEVLMLDEPLAGLGPEESEVFGEKLIQMRRDLGLTIIIIEHHVPFMLRVCDYVYVLNFGQLLAEGKPEQIRTNREVAQAYMGQDAATLA